MNTKAMAKLRLQVEQQAGGTHADLSAMMDIARPSAPEHRTLRLTPEAAEKPTAVRQILNLQVGMGIVWILLSPCYLWGETAWPAIWLPVNFLLFDLYLLIRDWHGRRWQAASRRVRAFISYSPLMMVPSAMVLGIVGSGIREALRS